MSEYIFRQPTSLLLRQEWKRFGGIRQRARRASFAGRSPAAPPAVGEAGARADVPWTQHHEPATGDAAPRQRLSRLREETDHPPLSSCLTDNFSRTHNYLRISVTERCNLRCVYCMPETGVPLSSPAHLLTTPEIVYLSQLFVRQGVSKIRLTGGEPTVRKDIVELMKQVGYLRSQGLKELCLTTNGLTLYRKLDAMVEAGLTGVNLSLDTLDPHQFTIMTRRNGHDAVIRSIERILEMKKQGAAIKLKVNCVVMRGVNDREIVSFVELGKEKDLEVRFIEYMPFDGNKWSRGKVLGYQDILAMIRDKYPGLQKLPDHANDTSKTYQVPGFLGRIGFITSMTHNFCGTCNRLRITSDGNLKVCLFGNSEVSLRDILRESNNGKAIGQSDMEAITQVATNARATSAGVGAALPLPNQDNHLLEVIGAAVKRKKAKHAGMGELENMKNRPMILIGDHYSRSTSCPFPGHYAQQATTSPYMRPHTLAHQDFLMQSIPHIQLRRYHETDRVRIIPLRNTRPAKPNQRDRLRPVHSQPGFRKILCNGPSSWITPSEVLETRLPEPPNSPKPASGVFGLPTSSQRQAAAETLVQTVRTRRRSRNLLLKSNVVSQGQSSPTSGPSEEAMSWSNSSPFATDPQKGTLFPHRPPTTKGQPRSAGGSLRSELYQIGSTSCEGTESTHKLTAVIYGPVKPHFAAPSSAFSRPSSPAIPAPTNRSALERLSHLTSTGNAHMVDISRKIPTRRSAAATAFILFSNPSPYTSLTTKTLPKGDAMAVARIAGIQAVKKTADLIPLAHPGLGITGVEVDINLLTPSATECTGSSRSDRGEAGFTFGGVKITAYVSCDGKTGVEMEALTGANIAALTIYDMCKAVDKHMHITGVRVTKKTGGKSGNWSLNGEIPDPEPTPIFESVLQRRTAGSVHDPDHHAPPDTPAPLPRTVETTQEPPIAPEPTADFLNTAAHELDLFVANTTSPTKAAEIAGLRERHKALAARIKDIQTRLTQGHKPTGLPGERLRDGRVDHDVLQRLHREKTDIARQVLAWRIGAGSEIGELSGEEAYVFEQQEQPQTNDDPSAQPLARPAQWRWEAGVYGPWKDKTQEK